MGSAASGAPEQAAPVSAGGPGPEADRKARALPLGTGDGEALPHSSRDGQAGMWAQGRRRLRYSKRSQKTS